MKRICSMFWLMAMAFIGAPFSYAAEGAFTLSGAEIPPQLLRTNYGRMPKSVTGYDLNICNNSATRQSITSSAIYQALETSYAGLQPIGRQIMLAAVLQNQRRSLSSVLSVSVSSAIGVLSVLAAYRNNIPAGTVAGVTVGTMVAQQLISNLRPVLTSDQIERYESQVLEPALVLEQV